MPNVAMMLTTVMLMLMMFHANADDDTDDHDGNSENNDDENDYKGKEKKNSCRPPNERKQLQKVPRRSSTRAAHENVQWEPNLLHHPAM